MLNQPEQTKVADGHPRPHERPTARGRVRLPHRMYPRASMFFLFSFTMLFLLLSRNVTSA